MLTLTGLRLIWERNQDRHREGKQEAVQDSVASFTSSILCSLSLPMNYFDYFSEIEERFSAAAAPSSCSPRSTGR